MPERPPKREPWTLGQWLTFFFFYTVPGLILATIMGASIWVLVLLPITYLVRRFLERRRAPQQQERDQQRGHGEGESDG